MSTLEILKYPNVTLRKACSEIKEIDQSVVDLLDKMTETMYQAGGIGLAASQVGELVRVIVIDLGDDREPGVKGELYKLINPVIVDQDGVISSEEGCLSIPDVRALVTRFKKITVLALDQNGDKVEIKADGLLSICLQHEIDHLDGILFIDHLTRLKKEMIKNKLKKLENKK